VLEFIGKVLVISREIFLASTRHFGYHGPHALFSNTTLMNMEVNKQATS
jgi:hypothetical protein